MKKFFVMFVAMIVTVTASVCWAAMEYYSVPVTHLKNYIGNWYDANGEFVMTINNDYTINDYRITSLGYTGDTVAFYKIGVSNGSNSGNIYLQTFGSYGNNTYHEMLILNEETALRRTKAARYVESIGDIYLGMNQNQVVSLYGQPSSVENSRGSTTWKYNREGFSVVFSYGVVSSITIYSYGDRRFDKSGLSANSTRADFEYKYNKSVSRRGSIDIGYGELINIGEGEVSLRFFTPGYVF